MRVCPVSDIVCEDSRTCDLLSNGCKRLAPVVTGAGGGGGTMQSLSEMSNKDLANCIRNQVRYLNSAIGIARKREMRVSIIRDVDAALATEVQPPLAVRITVTEEL